MRQSNVQNTSGGSSDSLADVALYYYQTDLRTPALSNCGTPATTGPLCENNVFMSGLDKNLQQHMNTFTLGLGASGRMTYSSSYLTDTTRGFCLGQARQHFRRSRRRLPVADNRHGLRLADSRDVRQRWLDREHR